MSRYVHVCDENYLVNYLVLGFIIFYLIFVPCRFITTEELDQALREYNMHDGRDIKEILQEVDGDNVSVIHFC